MGLFTIEPWREPHTGDLSHELEVEAEHVFLARHGSAHDR